MIGDRELLYPDVEQLVHAAEELVRKGFTVLPYCNEDPVACQKLADVGCAAVMPLGSLIGSVSLQLTTNYYVGIDDVSFSTPVPEPASVLLIGSGLASLAYRRRIRRSDRLG